MRFDEVLRLDERQVHLIDALFKYKDDPDIYITFSDIMKVGINPQSSFETPLGIYAYPLAAMWNDVLFNSIPYAGDRKYIHVLRANGNVKELSKYTEDDLSHDIAIMRNKFRDVLTTPIPRLQNASATEHPIIIDILNKKGISISNDKKFRELYFKELDAYRDSLGEEYYINRHFDLWSTEAYNPRSASSKFWNITRNIALMIAENRGARASVVWNSVFRMLGYDGFSDKDGLGIIHKNEPTQAVFLSKAALQHVETVQNYRERPLDENILTTFASLDDFLFWCEQRGLPSAFWFKTLVNQWDELCTKGRSKNFELRDRWDFQDKLNSPEGASEMVERLMPISPILASFTIQQFIKNESWQTKELIKLVIDHMPFYADLLICKNALNPAFVKLCDDVLDRNDSRHLFSSRAVRGLIGRNKTIKSLLDGNREEEAIKLIQVIMRKLGKRVDPTVMSDKFIGDLIAKERNDAIPF